MSVLVVLISVPTACTNKAAARTPLARRRSSRTPDNQSNIPETNPLTPFFLPRPVFSFSPLQQRGQNRDGGAGGARQGRCLSLSPTQSHSARKRETAGPRPDSKGPGPRVRAPVWQVGNRYVVRNVRHVLRATAVPTSRRRHAGAR